VACGVMTGCDCGPGSMQLDPGHHPDAGAPRDAGQQPPPDDGGTPACGNALDLSGCACESGAAARSCYPGPSQQAGVGACVMGTQSCIGSGGELATATWGPCTGAGEPATCALAPVHCGTVSDGCGGTLDCGSCGEPDAGEPDAGSCGPDGTTCGVVELCRPLGQCMSGACVQPPATMCGTGDIQVTVTWDNVGLDMELHLIRPGGHLNAGSSDCTWTTCVSASPDWGVPGDPSDNPHKDVDNTGYFGPENIYLNHPETGDYAVYVEHWGGGGPSTVQVTISIQSNVVYTSSITGLASEHVWDVARIHWPAMTVTGTGGDIDCTASWRLTSAGCDLTLP